MRPVVDVLNIELMRINQSRESLAKEYHSLRCHDFQYLWLDTFGIRLSASNIRFQVKTRLSAVFGIVISFSDYRQVRLVGCFCFSVFICVELKVDDSNQCDMLTSALIFFHFSSLVVGDTVQPRFGNHNTRRIQDNDQEVYLNPTSSERSCCYHCSPGL